MCDPLGKPSDGHARGKGRFSDRVASWRQRQPRRKGADMSESEKANVAEDLSLEGSEADAVVGGRTSKMASQIHHLESEGYVEELCTREGIQMFNPKTRKHKTVKYA
jgi:hypothetical protein